MQNKTSARLGIEVTGELAATIARINARPYEATSAYLIQNANGQPLTKDALRSRFDKARTLAGPGRAGLGWAGLGEFSVSGYSGQGGDRYGRPGALAKAAGAQEPGDDRALC